MERKGKGFLTIGQVAFVSLRDHNETEKVMKRGYKMDSPSEYIILKLNDGETDEIFPLFLDRWTVQKHKDELLELSSLDPPLPFEEISSSKERAFEKFNF